jgi:hypothetical protein
MPRIKDQDKADEGQAQAPEVEMQASPLRRIKGAYFLGGAWYGADGSLLNDRDAQAAHRAMDKEATEARARILRGEA